MSGASPLEGRLLEALRALGGKATRGDLAQRAGLALHEVEGAILGALAHVGGHVAVDDHGNLVYAIDRTRALPRFGPSWAARVWLALWGVFQLVYFAALSCALVVYFVVYIVLIIAVLVAGLAAAAKGGDCDCDCDCKLPDCKGCGDGCQGCTVCCDGSVCHGCNRAGDTLYRKTVARGDPQLTLGRSALRQIQAQTRAARRIVKVERAKARAARIHNALASLGTRFGRGLDFPLEVEVVADKPPFFRAVHAFVFGPPRARATLDAEAQNVLGFVRDHGGRVTATDAVLLTGLPRADAERLLLELAVRQGGDVEVDEQGVIVYTFASFVVSAGADVDLLGWLEARPDGRVSVSDFARAKKLTAADALSRLELLAEIAGARVEHGATTTFVFDGEARQRLAAVSGEHEALRDYRYAWEKAEKAPAILGVPAGSRGWIWGLNTFNFCVSVALCWYYLVVGERVVGELFGFMSPTLELWLLGLAPLALSAGVFVIPLVRLVVEGARDRGRKRRNERRYLLLGLAHALQSGPIVRAGGIRVALNREPHAEGAIDRWLTRLGAELDATLSPDGELTFDVAYRELGAVSLSAAELDPARAGIKAIVYDTARPH